MESKKYNRIFFKFLAILLSSIGANTFGQSILMDFGTTLTTSPDANGRTWNNYTNNGALNLVTSQGGTTAYYFTPNVAGTFNTGFVPSGANLSAFGSMGIQNAASDAIYTTTSASYYFYNVNPNLTYNFSLLGSRDATTTRQTQYTITGTTSGSGSVTTSGTGIGTGSVNYNNSNLVNITGITSTNFGGSIGNGVLLTMTAQTGGFAYLNAMSIEGYIGYLNGGTTTLNGAPAAGYVGNGTYANSDSRSVDTVIGGGSTVTVNNANGIYYNSTLIMTNGGGTVNAGANFEAYKLDGTGNLSLGGSSKLSLNHSGAYSGTLTLNGANLALGAANALGTGNLVLNGGSVDVGNASALGTGSISVSSGTTTLNNTAVAAALTGNNALNLNGGGTLQVNGYGKTLSFGTGNVAVSGFNNLNAWNGGMQFDGGVSGSGTLNWYGGGSLVLGNSNSFSGTVTASGNNGTLTLANTNALRNAILNKGSAQTLAFGVAGNNTYNLSSLTGSGDINLGGNTLNITNGGAYSGSLSGTGGIRVAGETTLSGANSFSGGVDAVSGQLNINSASALGTGTLTLRDGAQFRNSSGGAVTNSGNNAMILNGTNQFTGGILDMGTGTVTLGGVSRLNTTTGNLTLSGNLIGTNSFSKDGIGTLTLAGSNSTTSMIVVDYGTLALANSNALANASLYVYGTTANKKVSFALTGNNNYNIGDLNGTSTGSLDIGANTITLGASGRSGSFAGQMIGTGGNFTKSGAGSFTLSGSNNYTGTTTVQGGVLNVTGDISSSSGTSVQAGSTLSVASGGRIGSLTNAGTATISGTAGAIISSSSTTISSGGTVNGLTVSGGTTVVNGTAGNTAVQAGSTLSVASGGRIGSLTNAGTATITGTAGDLNNSGTATISGTAGAVISSSATTISSGGTAGSLMINGGTTVVNGTAGNTKILSGGTLKGSGSVGALEIASGGTLAMGNSPGSMTAASAIWKGGGSYDWEVNNFLGSSGSNFDFLNITGGLTIDATSGNKFIIDVISLLADNSPGEAANFNAFSNYTFTIATAAGGVNGFNSSYFDVVSSGFANSMKPVGATISGSWNVSQSGNNILLNYTAASTATAIPEPSSCALMILGLGILGMRRRSRR